VQYGLALRRTVCRQNGGQQYKFIYQQSWRDASTLPSGRMSAFSAARSRAALPLPAGFGNSN